MKRKEKTEKELKEFGQVMALACLVFTALGLLKRHAFGKLSFTLLIFSSVFYAFSALAPNILRRPEKIWMNFAEKLGTIMTFLVMFITFYGILTPLGLVLRVFGKDILSIRIDKTRKTYWEPVEVEGPGKRFYLPY